MTIFGRAIGIEKENNNGRYTAETEGTFLN